MNAKIDETTDQEWKQLIDFEIELPCDAPDGCDRAPVWSMRMKCCAKVYLTCQEHFDHDEQIYNASAIMGGYPARCLSCKTEYKNVTTLHDLFIITRL